MSCHNCGKRRSTPRRSALPTPMVEEDELVLLRSTNGDVSLTGPVTGFLYHFNPARYVSIRDVEGLLANGRLVRG